MLSLLFIVVFLFCVAIAIASCWIAHQFTTTYNTKFHQTYFYYLITFFGFAFYGIWAQILVRSLLSMTETDLETIQLIANFLPVIGVPFLVISWVMLAKLGYNLVQATPKKGLKNIHFTALTILLVLLLGLFILVNQDRWYLLEHLAYIEVGTLLLLELIYMSLFASVVGVHSKRYERAYRSVLIQFVVLMLLGLLIRMLIFSFHEVNLWVFAPLLVVYFLSNFVPVLYLKFKSDLLFTPVSAEHPNEEKKALLFNKFKITKREKEIIDKICQGKTNQQIADELFIGLQTVKDHTHRIYSKVGINSRLKLVQMING